MTDCESSYSGAFDQHLAVRPPNDEANLDDALVGLAPARRLKHLDAQQASAGTA